MDYSHCIFKIENSKEQDISGIREDVESGKIVLDPFESGNLCDEWLNMNMVVFTQFRPVAPNGPPNVWAKDENGQPGRGIQYPFVKPRPANGIRLGTPTRSNPARKRYAAHCAII
jgi:hypothetical protein